MSKVTEDVLLVISHVRHKKSNGNLYLMTERLGWMLESKKTFSVAHSYADIKVQKVSPDSKEKVQLQVILYDTGASTFHFVNPRGRDAQIKDRDSLKEYLQQLLPKFRNKVNSELQEKNRILNEDKELFQLYKDLVVSGIITSDEFWADRTKQTCTDKKQLVGVNAAFLADIKPQSNGCNGFKYDLSIETIEAIFRTYPTVQQKHIKLVPEGMTESEFWTLFFQSHYFHRDRVEFTTKDIFADCAKIDEQEIQDDMAGTIEKNKLNLITIKDSTLEEGFGLSLIEKKAWVASHRANTCLLRRFNHHSARVLKTSDQPAAAPAPSDVNDDAAQLVNGDSCHTADDHPPCKRSRMNDGSTSASDGVTLKLAHVDRYLCGPTKLLASTYDTSEAMKSAAADLQSEIEFWRPNSLALLHSNVAMSVLKDLTPGGNMMQEVSSMQLSIQAPPNIETELKNLYKAQCELLRHFWACFPVTSPQLDEKLNGTKAAIEKFRVGKLLPMKDRLLNMHLSANLINHLEDLIHTAINKFNTWLAKKRGRR